METSSLSDIADLLQGVLFGVAFLGGVLLVTLIKRW